MLKPYPTPLPQAHRAAHNRENVPLVSKQTYVVEERERARGGKRGGEVTKHKQWLWERGGACSLPEVGGACGFLVVSDSLFYDDSYDAGV